MPGGTFIPIRLEDLIGDVLIATPGNGQVLTYNSGAWVNSTPSSGGSPGGSSGQLQYNASGSFAGAAGVTYASSGNNFTVVSQNATDVPLTVTGAPSQSGNLVECRDSGGVLRSRVAGVGNRLYLGGYAGVGVAAPPTSASLFIGTKAAEGDRAGFYLSHETPASGFGFFFYQDGTTYLDNYSNGDIVIRSGSGYTEVVRYAQSGNVFAAYSATSRPVIARGVLGQTGSLVEGQDQSGNPLTAWLSNGAWRPSHMADSLAANDTVYYSTDAGKLVYKDAGGTVNNLY